MQQALIELTNQHSPGFNPHPARRPDATSIKTNPSPKIPTCFNPHPARRPDATDENENYKAECGVSILIQPEGRMQLIAVDTKPMLPLVSILIQPEGRMQPRPSCMKRTASSPFQSSSSQKAGCNGVAISTYNEMSLFQSSSSQKAGCNRGRKSGHDRCTPGFNPHPARRPDATRRGASVGRVEEVSILIQPEGRMQLRLVAGPGAAPAEVSILIQPEGRMQRLGAARVLGEVLVSILIQPEGRMQPPWAQNVHVKARVSILIQPEGRMQLLEVVQHGGGSRVSILIQPEGRMQPMTAITLRRMASFQSSSSQKAGCNAPTKLSVTLKRRFQSSSSQKAGCNAP